MKTLVCVKAGFSSLELQPSGNGAGRPSGFLMTNQADECAIALAASLQSKNDGDLTLVSVAGSETEEILDFYVGLGADAIIRVWDEILTSADTMIIARVLSYVAKRVMPEVILCGDRARGGESSGLTGPLLAEFLGWPFLGSLVKVERSDEREITCFRLIERGDRQIIKVPLPAVLAASPEGQASPYPSYKRIRRARRKFMDLGALAMPTEEMESLAFAAGRLFWTTAKPKPRKLFTPPSTASAADRMRMIMGGGKTRKPQSNLIEGAPDEVADQILQFLRQERLI